MKTDEMSVKEANRNFVLVCQEHCIAVQTGMFGEPTIQDLQFVGKIHSLIEEYRGGTK